MDKIKGEGGGGREEGGRIGWGGVEGWGENADNCNWIKINLKNNKIKIIILYCTVLHIWKLLREWILKVLIAHKKFVTFCGDGC